MKHVSREMKIHAWAGQERGGALKRPGERRESLGGTCLKCSLPRSWGVDRGGLTKPPSRKDHLVSKLEKLFPVHGERVHSLYFWIFKNKIERGGQNKTTDLSIYPRL